VAELGPLGPVARRRVRVRQRDDIGHVVFGGLPVRARGLDVVQRDGRLVLQLRGLDRVAEERALLGPPGGVQAERGQEVVDDWPGQSKVTLSAAGLEGSTGRDDFRPLQPAIACQPRGL
jgi:hypothetical protein